MDITGDRSSKPRFTITNINHSGVVYTSVCLNVVDVFITGELRSLHFNNYDKNRYDCAMYETTNLYDKIYVYGSIITNLAVFTFLLRRSINEPNGLSS